MLPHHRICWLASCLATVMACTQPGELGTVSAPPRRTPQQAARRPAVPPVEHNEGPSPADSGPDARPELPPRPEQHPPTASAPSPASEPGPGRRAEAGTSEPSGAEPAASAATPPPANTVSPATTRPGPTIHVVALDGSADQQSITAAIEAADYLDEIRIMPGTYHEAVVIDRRVSLTHGGGSGPVIIDGGPQPAVTLDRVTMVEVHDLVLKGGSAARAAVLVQQGQLRLESCRLDAAPGSAAAGAGRPGAQLVMVDCVVRAGEGTALAMVPESKGALESCRFSWNPDNTSPFISPEGLPVVTMRACTFGQKAIEGPFLVSSNLLAMLPEDGPPILFVEPERRRWPLWATAGETHFTSLATAVDRAPAHARLLVAAGVYREQVGIVHPLTIVATGPSGAVEVQADERSALWINAEGKVVLQGLVLRSSVGPSIPAVQINGGEVELIDCRIDNDAGHGLIVTSNHAPSQVTLSGCRLFSRNKALYGTGGSTQLRLDDCLLAGQAIALFLMDGATAVVSNSTFDTARYAVELWGPASSARLEGCTILRARQVLAFNEGASRSQVQTAGLIVK